MPGWQACIVRCNYLRYRRRGIGDRQHGVKQSAVPRRFGSLKHAEPGGLK
jgi:hypothetical protein